jgi:hypothetical protein
MCDANAARAEFKGACGGCGEKVTTQHTDRARKKGVYFHKECVGKTKSASAPTAAQPKSASGRASGGIAGRAKAKLTEAGGGAGAGGADGVSKRKSRLLGGEGAGGTGVAAGKRECEQCHILKDAAGGEVDTSINKWYCG